MILIEKLLSDAFLKIVEKHGNQTWAREELEWWVYEKEVYKYRCLSEEDRRIVDGYFSALKKIHGGN